MSRGYGTRNAGRTFHGCGACVEDWVIEVGIVRAACPDELGAVEIIEDCRGGDTAPASSVKVEVELEEYRIEKLGPGLLEIVRDIASVLGGSADVHVNLKLVLSYAMNETSQSQTVGVVQPHPEDGLNNRPTSAGGCCQASAVFPEACVQAHEET